MGETDNLLKLMELEKRQLASIIIKQRDALDSIERAFSLLNEAHIKQRKLISLKIREALGESAGGLWGGENLVE